MPFQLTRNDHNNLELVRQIVLYRLANDPGFHQFDYIWDPRNVGRFVEFDTGADRERFVVLATEVMWQLITQGVITPGMNSANPALPWFRITDYGQRVLESDHPIPHDPAGYLEDIRQAARDTVGDTAISYLQESLRCFTAGCQVACVLLIGVAAESIFLGLWRVIGENLRAETDRQKFDKLDRQNTVAAKHRWVVEKIANLPRDERERLPENVQMTLASLYDLIRQQRNELGHPREEPPAVDREQAFVFLRLLPTYIRHVESVAAYCRENGI